MHLHESVEFLEMMEVMFQSVDFLRVSANFLEYLKINSNSRKVPGIPGNNGRESLVSRFPSNSWKIRVISGNHGSNACSLLSGKLQTILMLCCKHWLWAFLLILYCGCVWPHNDYVSLQTSCVVCVYAF